jgi:flagellar protein FliS
MAAFNAQACYREHQITTADRGQLLIMVYDGMLRSLAEGQRAMTDKRIEAQHSSLLKAQRLLGELITTLDHAANPQLAGQLDRLYRFMFDSLTRANIYDDTKLLTEVIGLLKELRGAWVEADATVRNQVVA